MISFRNIMSQTLTLCTEARPVQENNRPTSSVLAVRCLDTINRYAMLGDHQFLGKRRGIRSAL